MDELDGLRTDQKNMCFYIYGEGWDHVKLA